MNDVLVRMVAPMSFEIASGDGHCLDIRDLALVLRMVDSGNVRDGLSVAAPVFVCWEPRGEFYAVDSLYGEDELVVRTRADAAMPENAEGAGLAVYEICQALDLKGRRRDGKLYADIPGHEHLYEVRAVESAGGRVLLSVFAGDEALPD